MPPRSIAALRADRADLADAEICEFAFPGALRDALVAAVLSGEKTATTGLVVDYRSCDEAIPTAGAVELVVDSEERVVAAIELTRVDERTVGEVDLAVAVAEGEGYASVADWRAGHDAFWTSPEFREAIGVPDFVPTDDEPAVVVWFRVVERF